jgi:hypothetical protein
MTKRCGSPSPDFMYISASAPEAPPFSDTITGCLIMLCFWMVACSMRAIWSDAPPAPAATTISTVLVGSHATAGVAGAASAKAAPAQAMAKFFDLAIISLPWGAATRATVVLW